MPWHATVESGTLNRWSNVNSFAQCALHDVSPRLSVSAMHRTRFFGLHNEGCTEFRCDFLRMVSYSRAVPMERLPRIVSIKPGLLDWLIDWLIDWLYLTCFLTGSVIWSLDWLIDWSFNFLHSFILFRPDSFNFYSSERNSWFNRVIRLPDFFLRDPRWKITTLVTHPA